VLFSINCKNSNRQMLNNIPVIQYMSLSVTSQSRSTVIVSWHNSHVHSEPMLLSQCSNCQGVGEVEPPWALSRYLIGATPLALLNFNPIGGRRNPPNSLAMNLLLITRPLSTTMHPILRNFNLALNNLQNRPFRYQKI